MAVNTIHMMTREQLIKTLKSVLDQNELLRRDKEKMGAEIERLRGGQTGHALGGRKPEGWSEPVWWQL